MSGSTINSLLPTGWSIESEDTGWAIYDDEDRPVVQGMNGDDLRFQLVQLVDLQMEWAIATMCEHYRRQAAES